jgi:hypothetical protein
MMIVFEVYFDIFQKKRSWCGLDCLPHRLFVLSIGIDIIQLNICVISNLDFSCITYLKNENNYFLRFLFFFFFQWIFNSFYCNNIKNLHIEQ